MNLNFPVPFPPSPRLPLGQWVQLQFSYIPPDHPADPCYFKEQGIIIGYGFHHPAWSETHYIHTRQLPEENAPQGWDYLVLRIRTWDDSTNEWRDGDTEVITVFESDVTPIDLLKTFISLGIEAIHEIFPGPVAGVLSHPGSEARIQTLPYALKLIAPDREKANKLFAFQNEIAQAIKTYNLPPDVLIRIPEECLHRFKAEQTPTLKLGNQHIGLNMPERTIPQRAQRHRPLLEAIAPQCAVVTLHDIDPETGYQYLDLLSPTPKRGNKPREALIGNSVLTVAPSIGEPRFKAIERALETRQCQAYRYTYDDPNGLHWVFDVTVPPLLDDDGKPTAVLTIVHDAEPWQRAYWFDREERSQQQ